MWEGKLAANRVVSLTLTLLSDPNSRVFAIREGEPRTRGWDENTLLLARTHNLIASFIASQSKKKPPPEFWVEYPKKKVEEQPKTFREMNLSLFQGFKT